MLGRLGSLCSTQLGWRDMWAMVTVKGGRVLGEEQHRSPDFGSWAVPVSLVTEVELTAAQDAECGDVWGQSEEAERRREFCGRIEGFGSVCHCREPAPIVFLSPPVLNNKIAGVPVVVIASNRPSYLYRMLQSLLSASGARPDHITVYIDGFYEEPLAVTRLFGLRGVQHSPVGHRNARISQHYKASLSNTFQLFPRAQYAIVLEEDLDVSPDFFSYFSQTVRLLEEDPSLYCVSAWNDLGYEHTSGDPSLLYRVETMPGLGWMLKRSLFEQELEPVWPTPDKTWDWDMWMRVADIRKERECVIPDISRTYHFGSSGLNMNSYFHHIYFDKHSFNTEREVELEDVETVKQTQYEERLRGDMRTGQVLNRKEEVSPCQEDFYTGTRGPALLFIQMEHAKDFTTWLALAKCLHVWDLDARGFHNGMWRLHLHGRPVFVIGTPFSPYSIHMPEDVRPVCMDKKETV
jgi:beta-1,2-N-acetylglucosaminyltransferase